ncbi:MAG: hypothetical protein R3F31_13640 [Verrucomicrobiales bacterium]
MKIDGPACRVRPGVILTGARIGFHGVPGLVIGEDRRSPLTGARIEAPGCALCGTGAPEVLLTGGAD